MNTLVWVIFGLIAFSVVVAGFARLSSHTTAWAERASRPLALLGAELTYVEKVFRITEPVRLVAKPDRGYRLPSGVIVLVEFKTRWISRPCRSDVVQLSAQRLALEGQTKQTVAAYGYVVTRMPRAKRHTAHRVELLPNAALVALVKRREDILAGRVAPQYAASRRTCQACAFRSECEGPRRGGTS